MTKLSIAFLAAVSLASFGCKKKGGGAGGEALAKVTEFKDAACKCTDKACADKVQADVSKWQGGGTDMSGWSKEDAETYSKAATEMANCLTKAMNANQGGAAPAGGSGDMAGGGSAAPAGGGSAAPAAGGGGDLPAECADYKAAIEALAKCDKLPQATRDALKQSYEQTSAAWAQVPAEGKAALGTACKSAADAVKQSAAACN